MMTACVCGETAAIGVSEKDGVTAARCCKCGVIRTTQRSEDYLKTYTEGDDYHAGRCQEMYGYAPYHKRYAHDGNIAALRIPRYMRHFKSLDVGCANGAFVAAMYLRGYSAHGLELNPAMAKWAALKTGCPIYTSWRECRAAHGREDFQLVTYHDVFEHVVDPSAELITAFHAIAAGGVLVLDVPDADEVFGKNARAPHHEKPEQHLWYWSEATLVPFIAQHGFVAQEVYRPIIGKLVVCATRQRL